MKRTLLCIVALLVPLCCPAQDAGAEEKPWESWVPPRVEFPEPNAFAIYEEAFKLIDEIGEVDSDTPLETLSVKLEDHRATFLLLREAIKGECQLPLVTSASQELPYLAKFREAARMFAARSRYMREYGMYLESALDCVDSLRMAVDVGRQGVLISYLVSVAIDSIALTSLQETVPFLNETESRVVISALRDIQKTEIPMADVVEGEAVSFRHILIQQMAAIEEQGGAKLPEELEKLRQAAKGQPGLWSPVNTWREGVEYYDKLKTLVSQPEWSPLPEIPISDPMVSLLVPVMDRVVFGGARARATLRLAVANVAAHAYWVANGEPPENLDELVPDYLPEVPLDPFSGERLLGPIDAGGLVIYSVGPDKEDDRGSAVQERVDKNAVGDIVVQLREPRAG